MCVKAGVKGHSVQTICSLTVSLHKQPPLKWEEQIRHIVKDSSILFRLLFCQYNMNNANCSPVFHSIA